MTEIKKYKPIVHTSPGGFNPGLFEQYNLSKPVELFSDILPSECTIKNPNGLKVFFANEPKEILPHVHQHLLHNSSYYDLIFTWDPDLLKLGKANIKYWMYFHYWCHLFDVPSKKKI